MKYNNEILKQDEKEEHINNQKTNKEREDKKSDLENASLEQGQKDINQFEQNPHASHNGSSKDVILPRCLETSKPQNTENNLKTHRRSFSEKNGISVENRLKNIYQNNQIRSLNFVEVKKLSPSDEISLEMDRKEIIITDESEEKESQQIVLRNSEISNYKFADQVFINQVYKKVFNFLGLASLRIYQILLIIANFIYKFCWISFVYGFINQSQGTPTGYHILLFDENDPGEQFLVISSIITFLLQVLLQILSELYAIKRLRNQQNIKKSSLIGLYLSLFFELIGFLLMQYYMWSSDTIYKIIGIAIFSQTFMLQGYYISKYKKIYQKLLHCELNLQINPLLLHF